MGTCNLRKVQFQANVSVVIHFWNLYNLKKIVTLVCSWGRFSVHNLDLFQARTHIRGTAMYCAKLNVCLRCWREKPSESYHSWTPLLPDFDQTALLTRALFILLMVEPARYLRANGKMFERSSGTTSHLICLHENVRKPTTKDATKRGVERLLPPLPFPHYTHARVRALTLNTTMTPIQLSNTVNLKTRHLSIK